MNTVSENQHPRVITFQLDEKKWLSLMKYLLKVERSFKKGDLMAYLKAKKQINQLNPVQIIH
jgi:hypothetical protein